MKILLRSLDLDRVVFNLKINWAMILSFATFWCYGYFGTIAPKNLNIFIHLIISIILYIIFLLFMFLGHKYSEYKDSIIIRVKDIFVFLTYFIIMFILSFKDLLIPLSGDQLSHAWYSQAHMIQAILILSKATNFFNNLVFSKFLYLFNIITLIFVLILCYIFRNKSFLTKTIVLSVFFILFRAVIIKFWGSYNIHPELRLFPMWLSSSIFSSNNISFRLPQFLGLVCFMWLFQRIMGDKVYLRQSWIFGLVIGTIPLLWHVGTLVEQSIWSTMVWTLLLLTISRYEVFDNFNWIRWSSFIAITTLMRLTTFLGLIPLFLLFFLNILKLKKLDIKKFFLILAPILVILPFLIRNFIFVALFYNIQKSMPTIQKVSLALTSVSALKIILATVTLPWLIFLPFAFITFPSKSKKLTKAIAYFIFFTVAFFIFYSLDPCHWIIAKHKTEFIIPFVLVGFYHILIKFDVAQKAAFRFVTIALIFLLCFNVYVYKNLYGLFKKSGVYTQELYNYDEALKAVRLEGYAGSTVIAGETYGVLPEITNNFTISQVSSSFDIYKQVMKPLATVDFQALNENKKIKLVLVSDMYSDESREKLILLLLSNGWKPWKDFRYLKSDSVIYGFIRLP